MIRRSKPLQRSQKPIRKHRKVKKSSLRYKYILPGLRQYPDGRQVCEENAAGREIYKFRTEQMALRQDGKCAACGLPMVPKDTTFDHERPRGMGAAFRDDKLWDFDGSPMNRATHGWCNAKRGSRRL
jgi:hypothetical protein